MVYIKWIAAEGTQTDEPASLEVSSKGAVLRKDIAQETREDGEGNSVTYWTYYEARLTTAEYEEYLADIEAPSTASIMQALSDVQAEQELGSAANDASTETIMQAISDMQADIALLDI